VREASGLKAVSSKKSCGCPVAALWLPLIEGMVNHKDTVVPKRIPAVSNEMLLFYGKELDDLVQLLPSQVILMTGLSENQLHDRKRMRPPLPPFPSQRKPGASLWYSMGSIPASG